MRSHLRGPLFTYGASCWTTSPPAPAPGCRCLPTVHPGIRSCPAPPSAKSAAPSGLRVAWDGRPLYLFGNEQVMPTANGGAAPAGNSSGITAFGGKLSLVAIP